MLWTLRNGAKQLACSVRLLPHDLQLHLALNGDTPYCSRTFQTQDEWLAWAEEERVQSLGSGTTSSKVSRTATLPCAFARTNPATESEGWSCNPARCHILN